ncbi:MAG: GntR family transcriptional regulator [Pseudoclavibacter sp.]
MSDAFREGRRDGRRLSAVVYDTIREKLLTGQWEGGEVIPVDSIKAELGVSKQPVMEALRRLSVDGLVDVVPQVGCRVAKYPLEEAVDFFNVFATTEAEIAAIAVLRHTPQQLARLREANRRLADAIDSSGTPQADLYLVHNREFHSIVQEMTHSPVLFRTSSRMWDLSDLLIASARKGAALATEIHDRCVEHDRIIDAVANGDQEAARREMHAHIVRNTPMLERISQA